jgi:glycosyltransferase involved in cell wall biosynthesis
MIGRNDEQYLDESICSVRRFVDDVIYVDTGSTDNSVVRAKKLGAKVHHFLWCDDFSAARNFALSCSDSDWFLTLDCDERVVNPKEIRKAIEHQPDDIEVLTVAMSVKSKGQLATPFLAARMGRKGVTYKYPIHEQLDTKVEKIANAPIQLIHLSGDDNNQDSGKRTRNIEMLEGFIAKDEIPLAEKSYFLHRLAEEYIVQQRWYLAESTLKECIRIEEAEGTKGNVACNAHKDLGYVLWKTDRHMDAIQKLAEAQKLWPKYTDLWFLCSGILRHLHMFDEAENVIHICLQMGDPPIGYNSYGGTGSWRAQQALKEIQNARHVQESRQSNAGVQSLIVPVQGFGKREQNKP